MRAFTLLQCLITLAIIGAVCIFSQPNYSHLTQKNLGLNASKNLQQALQYARMQAISKHVIIAIGPKNGVNWANGFVVSQGKQPLKTYQPTRNVLISWHGFGDRQKKIYIHPNGMTHNNGHFTVKTKHKTSIDYQVSVSKTLQSKITQLQ